MRAVLLSCASLVASACVAKPPATPDTPPTDQTQLVAAPAQPRWHGGAALTILFRVPELCEPASLVTIAATLSEISDYDARAIAAAVEAEPTPQGCALAMGPDLRTFLAVLPRAQLTSGNPPAGDTRLRPVVVGDAVVVGPPDQIRKVLGSLGLRAWVGWPELDEQCGDAHACALARLDAGRKIEGVEGIGGLDEASKTAPLDRSWLIYVDDDAAVLELRGMANLSSPPPAPPLALELLLPGTSATEIREPAPGVVEYRRVISNPSKVATAIVSGALAALLVETTSKIVRRRLTAEARLELDRMFKHIVRVMYDDPNDPTTFRGCPLPGRGQAGWTPALDLHCGDGDAGCCVPGASGAGGYDAVMWSGNPLWTTLDFSVLEPHAFHYNVRWRSFDDPSGCQFTAQAFGDLDDDGVYSTFERAAAADHVGVNAPGLYVDKEVE